MGTLKVIGSALYQWEIGRKIRVDTSVGTRAVVVQFAHPGDNEALSVTPKEENGVIVAEVPNIMLQSGDKLLVFLVEMDENCVETTRHSVFHVVNRPKPADYIYTETEVLNYTYLDNRLKDLEGDGLAQAVEDYLKKNPVSGGGFVVSDIDPKDPDMLWIDPNDDTVDDLQAVLEEALAIAKEKGIFDGADGKDGANGKDGYTPVKGKDYFDGEAGYTPQKGVDYFDGKDGQDGKPGEDGKTPVKGTDYWTSADKTEMVNSVLSALPTWNGGSY